MSNLLSIRVLFLYLFFLFSSCQYLLADDIKFVHLTINEGLSQNTVNTIYQDHKGLIWIGTLDGLNKYDGYDFVVYRNDGRNPKSLNDNRVNAVIEDKKNHIWVGTSSGLNLFDRKLEEFKSYPNKANKPYAVYQIVEDKNGTIWIATDEGVKYLDPLKGKLVDLKLNDPINDDVRVQSLFVDKNNVLWVGKFVGLLFYDIDSKRLVNPYPSLQNAVKKSWVRNIKFQEDGSVWLATEADGVIHYQNERKIDYYSIKNGLLTNTVRDILIVNAHEVWIGSKFGLSILNPVNQTIKSYTYKKDDESGNSLSQSSIRCFFKDKKGNIWLGTYYGGINLVYNFKENFYYKGHAKDDPSKLSNKEVNCIIEDQQKNVWLATDGGGLNYWDRKYNKVIVFKYAAGHSVFNTIKTMHQDLTNKNIIWLGTGGGVLKFDKVKHTFKPFIFTNHLNPPEFIQQFVFEETKQGLWIGNNFGGLYLFKGDQKLKSYDQLNKSFFNSDNITDLKDDDGKGLWIGNRTSGLNYLNYKTGQIASYVYDKGDSNSLSSNNILCLFKDSKHRLWIGTDGGGLNYFDPQTKKFITLDRNNGLLNNVIHAITEDESGALWLSTNRGIFKITLKIKYNPLKFDALKIVNYTVEDGLQSNQFLDYAVFNGSNNELFFGGINGLTSFFPNQLSVNNDKPNIVFTELSILGRPINITKDGVLKNAIDDTEEIILPHNESSFTIKFALLNFIHPEKNKYAYRLEGFSNDTWHYVNDQRQATYTNLDAGTYLFNVKAANNSGVWGEQIKTLKIIILPPWYHTWWAYGIYFIIILFLLYIFYSYTKYKERLKGKIIYEKYIAKQERELAQQKLSFFIKISHEIKTPITMILAPLQKLLSRYDLEASIHQNLEVMNKSGQRLLNLIDQLLDIRNLDPEQSHLKAAKGNIVAFINEIVVISSNLAKTKNIDLTFSSSSENIEVWFDRDKMEKVIYNLLSNAVKYTPEYGKIIVSIDELSLENKVMIKVTDNGCGITSDRLTTIFTPFKHEDSMLNNVTGTGIGLAFAKELVDLHHGEISVNSRTALNGDNGFTCFEVKLLMGNQHLKKTELDENYLQAEHISNYKDDYLSRKRNFEEIKNLVKSNHGVEKLTMLLIEDNAEVLNFLADHFEQEFEVFTAMNGNEGKEKALKIIPEIIISDVMMPEMDGVQLCRLLKEDINTSHIPIVLLTARSPFLFKLEGLKNGADEYISKPFNLDLLEVKVWNLILNRQKMQARFQKQVLLEPTNTLISSFDDLFIERVMKYIEDNMVNESLNVEDLSAHVGMTRGNLYKKLKALTSKSPIEFIRYIRLQRAAQLLKQKKMYINEVAYLVGFQDVNYFRKCFKEEFSINPTEFAKQFESN